MKLNSKRDFPDMTVEEWFAVLLDPDFDEYVESRLDLQERKVLESRKRSGVIERKVRIVPNVPRAFRRFVKSRFHVIEESAIDVKRNLITWKMTPSAGEQTFVGTGTVRLVPAALGCTRILDGVIELDVPLLGKRIESKLVELIMSSYERASTAMEEWYRSRG